jgi:hypothetical protein
MGRSEKPNIGLPILGNLFLLGYTILRMVQSSEGVKAAAEAMMGRSEKPNIGLPLLGNLFLLGYTILRMVQSGEGVKAAAEAMRNKEMGSCK